MKIISAISVVIIIGAIFYFAKTNVLIPNDQDSIENSENSVVGCYVVKFNNDVYSLAISAQSNESVRGNLVFKNFEKDSSSGTFEGTYKDGILLGDYSFMSEGIDSVMEVIFKRSGDDFIRGYGPVNAEGTRFTDLEGITFDSSSPLSVFKFSDEICATSL